jgi:hypothetical protein
MGLKREVVTVFEKRKGDQETEDKRCGGGGGV